MLHYYVSREVVPIIAETTGDVALAVVVGAVVVGEIVAENPV